MTVANKRRRWAERELVRLLHRTFDGRIPLYVPKGVTAPRRGTIREVIPATRTLMVEMEGSTKRTPVRGYPAFPVLPRAGDEAVFDRSLDGWLMPTHILGRDAAASDAVGFEEYGAKGDGIADDTSAVQAALTADRGHYRFRAYRTYNVRGNFQPRSNTLIDAEPGAIIRMTSTTTSRLFVIAGKTNVHLRGLVIDGNKGVVPTDALIVFQGGSTYCSLRDCRIYDMPGSALGGILMTSTVSDIVIDGNQFVEPEGTAVGLSGATRCDVTRNRITGAVGSGGFGVRVGDGACENLVAHNRIVGTYFEPIGVTHNSDRNRIIGNLCTGGQTDNGISISGDWNVVEGNESYDNEKGGIVVWGSFNTIDGNVCRNANRIGSTWAAVFILTGFGGCGQFNVVNGNILGDHQFDVSTWKALFIDDNVYISWAGGQAVTAGVDYRVNGLNVYIAASTGTTSASVPPVHTSGTVSDGAVEWRFENRFVGVAHADQNHIGPNTIASVTTSPAIEDQNLWVTNSYVERTLGRLTVGALYTGWTSVNDIVITKAGNAGIAIHPGAANLGRVAFGDGSAVVASLEHDRNTAITSLRGGSAHGQHVQITANNNVLVGTASLAQAATGGFPYIPTMAGAPSGTPTAHTGRAPIVFDTTNSRLYIYHGGAWHYIAQTA